MHFSHGIECQHCVDEGGVLFDWCPSGAGPAVAQLLPNVVGRLLRFSVSLPDPTEVLNVLQDSSLDHFELVTPHMVHMVRMCQLLSHSVECSSVPSASSVCASLSAGAT